MKKKFLLTHQTQFMRAPYLFPETRFFVFTAGYGAGKTSSVATAVLYDMYKLKDAKDKEGRRPRLGLGGKSLGHLVKTTLGYILSDLENSKTPYKYNSKDNVLSVGNADLYLVSLSRPGDIVGYDVCGFYGDEVDDLGSVTASSAADMTFEAIKAINERTRQVIPGFRSPFVKLASTSQGQKGLYRVVTQFNKENTGYVRIKARTRDNTNLKLEYVDSLYRFYTETEAKVYLEGEFLSVGSGRIFPDFDWEHNFARLPMDRMLQPGEELYWSQDFNSLSAGEKILTNKGYRPIKDIKVGDFVLTRQGYKKVLTNKEMGEKLVVRCGSLWTTLEHPFITEKGDEERCKIQNYYYLPMHTKLKLYLVKTLQLKLQKLEFYLMELSIEKIDRETITNLEKEKTQKFYTEQFTNIISAPFLKVLLFTIKMGLWTIGLKVLSYLQEKHILKHITAEKELRNTGNKDALNLQGWCVSSAEKLLQDVSKLLLPVQKHVDLNIEQKDKKQQENKDVLDLKLVRIKKRGKIANRLNWFADGVALAMKERKGLITALRALKPAHTTADGNVLYGVKRTVWDLEVEDAHEFFAENILVHNCGYFRGCVSVLRGNCIYVVKRYEFEQIKDAPQVVRYDFPHNKIIWIPDASAKSEIMTFAAELRKYQIFWAFRGKNPNIEDTVFLVNKLLYMRRLVFTEMAKETAEACSLALRDTKTGLLPKGIGKRSPIHDIDALRMLCYFLIFTPVMKDIRDLTIRRRLEQWKDDEEYAGDAAAGRKIIKTGGFSIIEPDLL